LGNRAKELGVTLRGFSQVIRQIIFGGTLFGNGDEEIVDFAFTKNQLDRVDAKKSQGSPGGGPFISTPSHKKTCFGWLMAASKPP
jgi:hypothetical protein